MNLQNLLLNLTNCPCGREHTFDTKACEIGRGLVHRAGEILAGADFPKNILLVGDRNSMRVSTGLIKSLDAAGFSLKQLIFNDMRYARIEQVKEIEALCADVDGLLSVGTGSVNDICRVAAFNTKIQFAIFATAPSMDGFASDTAPIVFNNFKVSQFVRQPEVIIADTDILAASPAELKSAGFGDMIAKYTALVEWKIANLITGEYYCDRVADLTMTALKRLTGMADQITACDPEAAGEVMEALVFTGLAMKLTGNSRPASGSEHVLSHFWECNKLVQGIWPEFHGKKVGVATVLCNRLYRKIAEMYETVDPIPDPTNWDEVKAAYGPALCEDMMKVNRPTVTDSIDPAKIKECWPEIRRIILEELPTDEEMVSLMKRAGAATTPAEVNVSGKLLRDGIKYHAYMRYRVLFPRILPMLNIVVPDIVGENE